MKFLGAIVAFGLGFGLAFGSLHLLGDAADETETAVQVSLDQYDR